MSLVLFNLKTLLEKVKNKIEEGKNSVYKKQIMCSIIINAM